MTQERIESRMGIDRSDLEKLIDQKEPRLPKGIRRYIRGLKAEGKLVEAMKVTEHERKKKGLTREQKAKAELKQTIGKMIQTEDLKIEATEEVRAIWLLHATGEITAEEKTTELLETIDSKPPDIQAYLTPRLSGIRDELKPLLPTEAVLQTMSKHH